MKIKKLNQFVSQNLRRNRKNFIFSAIGIVIGISSFFFFVALGSGIKRVVSTEIFPQEANRILVVPRLTSLNSASGGRTIDEEALKRFSEIPGVSGVYPRMKLAVPATMALVGSQFTEEELAQIARLPGVTPRMVNSVRKLDLWMEIMADGIDPNLVKSEILFGKFADPEPGAPIPVLVSKRLVEIYNSSFATIRNLPLISEIILPYIPSLPLTLNDSYISRGISGPKQLVKVKVIGTSHHALLGGLTLPLETIRRFNLEFAGEEAMHVYDMAVLEVSSSDKLSAVQVAIHDMGFDIDTSQKRMAESVGFAVTLVMLGFTLISLSMVGVAAINISHTFFIIIYERKREIGLLRALGASRGDIRSMIFGEAALVGTAGGAAGIALGVIACILVNLLARNLLPEFPFKPEQFFAYPGWLFVCGLILAVMFCLVGAFSPANSASRFDPASTLSGR